MPTTKHLPDQPIMKYVHPADRLRPWFGVAVGLAALAIMLAFGILALLLAAVALGERIERGVEGPHFISLIRLTARGGFATIAPAVLFDVLKVTSRQTSGNLVCPMFGDYMDDSARRMAGQY